MSADLAWVLRAIDQSAFYRAALVYYGMYPVVMAIVWIVLSVSFFRRQERAAPGAQDYTPFVSVIIPAYAEEDTLPRTLEALLTLDYPAYEVVVVADGSPDGTAGIVRAFTGSGKVRLLNKRVNEGKAMALNDALPLCRGEILLVLDADIVVTPPLLRHMVPHFLTPRVAAVTGNPRVLNRDTMLQNLQAVEFSSIVSLQKRAQRIWGRVMTVSGAIFALRRTAALDVGGFSPDMATEDIDLTWKLQMRFWDVRYEPRAVVWMQVPPTLGELWKQRRRWARGLAQVLRRHARVLTRWEWRRMWPVFLESWFSILWAYTFVFMTLYWIVCNLAEYPAYGASPIPNFWGMIVATACLVQLFAGSLIDRRYDPEILRSFALEAVLYPLVYWSLTATITAIYTLDGLLRAHRKPQTWKIARTAAKQPILPAPVETVEGVAR